MPTGTLAPQARGHGRTKSRIRLRGLLKQCVIAGIINVWQRCDAWQSCRLGMLSYLDRLNGRDYVPFRMLSVYDRWIRFDLMVLDERRGFASHLFAYK